MKPKRFDCMSNETLLFFLQLIIYGNVTVNGGTKRWRLTFEFDDCYSIKVSAKKTGN